MINAKNKYYFGYFIIVLWWFYLVFYCFFMGCIFVWVVVCYVWICVYLKEIFWFKIGERMGVLEDFRFLVNFGERMGCIDGDVGVYGLCFSYFK